jgi:ADP-heptose:LPS heptosyltransferase
MEKNLRSKTVFTKGEITQIESLIREKLNADTNKQKQIRGKIRRIGFYWTDFVEESHQERAYDVENFRELIRELVSQGRIQIL